MRTIKKGATSQSLYFEVLDSASTSGGRKTGLAYNTSSLTAYYVRNGGSATAITLATLAAANSAWSSGGFKEVDATNMPGIYRLDVPDAAFASGADSVAVTIRGATGMVQATYDVQLVAVDPQDAVRGGMTALPNANAGASGGLPLSVDTSGRVDVLKINGTSQTARDIGASVLLSAGTGTGQLDFTSGVVKANLAQILGTALTETAGQIAAGFKKFFNVAAPAMDVTSVNQTGDSYGRIGANGGGLTAIGDTRLAHLDADVSTRLATSGYTSPPSAATIAQAVWDALTSALTTVGSIGKLLVTNIDTAISSRMATFSYTAPDNASISAIKAKTDNLPSDPASDSNVLFAASEVMSHGDAAWLTAAGFSTSADITGAVSTIEGYGDAHWATATGFSTLSAADVEAAVLDAAINDHLTDGTVGKEIYNAATYAGSADSKADTTLTNIAALNDLSAADVNAQADQALADAGVTTVRMGHLDADVSSRLAASSYTAPDDTAVLAAIAGLNDLSAAEVNAEVDTAIADAALATAASLATTDAKVGAVKDKTDQLGFSGSLVNANIAAVNGTQVQGDGTTGNEWGPA